jgi:hypothetical protein
VLKFHSSYLIRASGEVVLNKTERDLGVWYATSAAAHDSPST